MMNDWVDRYVGGYRMYQDLIRFHLRKAFI